MARRCVSRSPIAETGFDPQVTSDIYSSAIIGAIIDPLYRLRLLRAARAHGAQHGGGLPEMTDEGRTYTIKVKRGIYFAADPAFKGKRRELTAEDYVYSIKRIFDPKVRSYWLYMFEGNLVGLEDLLPARARAASSTTTRRSRDCRRSTATRCASASSGRITVSSGG